VGCRICCKSVVGPEAQPRSRAGADVAM